MLALISLVLRNKVGLFEGLKRDSGFGLRRDDILGLNIVRTEIFYENGISKSAIYRRTFKALCRLSKAGVRRAVVSDGFEFKHIITEMGISIINAKTLYIKMLPWIIRHCALLLGIDTQKAVAVIHGGNNNNDTLNAAMALKGDIRYLSIICSGGEEIGDRILNKSGISVMKGDVPDALYNSRIDIYLNFKDKSNILDIDGHSLSAEDIEFEPPGEIAGAIPNGVAAPFLAVLLDNGLIFPEKISIKKVFLRETVA